MPRSFPKSNASCEILAGIMTDEDAVERAARPSCGPQAPTMSAPAGSTTTSSPRPTSTRRAPSSTWPPPPAPPKSAWRRPVRTWPSRPSAAGHDRDRRLPGRDRRRRAHGAERGAALPGHRGDAGRVARAVGPHSLIRIGPTLGLRPAAGRRQPLCRCGPELHDDILTWTVGHRWHLLRHLHRSLSIVFADRPGPIIAGAIPANSDQRVATGP